MPGPFLRSASGGCSDSGFLRGEGGGCGVECGVGEVDVFGVHFLLAQPQTLANTIKVKYRRMYHILLIFWKIQNYFIFFLTVNFGFF